MMVSKAGLWLVLVAAFAGEPDVVVEPNSEIAACLPVPWTEPAPAAFEEFRSDPYLVILGRSKLPHDWVWRVKRYDFEYMYRSAM
jgi:hypothetical protein